MLYVIGVDGVDDTCAKQAPCRTLSYAITKLRPGKDVFHVSGGIASLDAKFVIPSSPYVIDGTNTTLSLPVGAALGFEMFGQLTLENVTLRLTSPGAIDVTGGALRLHNVKATIDEASALRSSGGALSIISSVITGGNVRCSNVGQMRILGSSFNESSVDVFSCTTNIAGNRFTKATDGILDVAAGGAIIENNLFIQAYELADSVRVAASPGATFRFNTIVNTSTTTSSGVALWTDATVNVTSNIFAYNSTDPIVEDGVTISHSLFDTEGGPDAGSNLVGSRASIFADFVGGDYHLASDSPAIGQGEPGLVTTDLDGGPRSSTPDIGALEAP